MLTLRLHNLLTLRHKQIDDVNSLVQQTSTIAAQVEDDALRTLLFQADDRLSHLLGTSFRKLCKADVARVFNQSHIGHSRLFNVATCDLEVTRTLFTPALHLQHECGARFTSQQFTHLRSSLALQVLVINLQQHIAHLQAHLSGRHVRVRFVDDDSRVFPHADDGADAAILTCGHHLQLVHVLLWIIHCVGIEFLQHGLNTCANHLVRLQRIYVEEIQHAVDVVEDVEALGHIKHAFCLGRSD